MCLFLNPCHLSLQFCRHARPSAKPTLLNTSSHTLATIWQPHAPESVKFVYWHLNIREFRPQRLTHPPSTDARSH